jgi:hypothetical protein
MRLPVIPFALRFLPDCCVGTAQRVPHHRRYHMQKLTRVTLGIGETAMHPGGRYLTSTGVCNHRQGFDDAVKRP